MECVSHETNHVGLKFVFYETIKEPKNNPVKAVSKINRWDCEQMYKKKGCDKFGSEPNNMD